MTLKEINARLDIYDSISNSIDPVNNTKEDWDRLESAECRVKYRDLPASIQKDVRQRHTPDTLRIFLSECYEIPDILIRHLPKEEQEQIIADNYNASFEGRTKGIPEKDINAILIKARNNATYTVYRTRPAEYPYEPQDKKVTAYLYGNHACEAFEAAVAEYEGKSKSKQDEETALLSHGKQYTAAANIMSAGYYQMSISDKQYQFALTTQANNHGYIALMTPEYFEQFDFSNGAITIGGQIAGHVKQYSKGKYEDLKELDLPLLTQMYTAAHKAHERHDAFTITVSTPSFFKEMGIKTSSGNAPDIIKKLHSFENCVGILPGQGTISKLFTIIDIDSKAQTMTFAIPYIARLLSILDDKNRIEKKDRSGHITTYIKPYNNMLVHSTIASERNKVSVELVQLITTGLLQRGTTPDSKTYRKKTATFAPDDLDTITYEISFRTLINNAPLLRSRINSYKGMKYPMENQNIALRRAFEKAYTLIQKKTDAFNYFNNLRIPQTIPTMKTLDDTLVITFTGVNGKYKGRS